MKADNQIRKNGKNSEGHESSGQTDSNDAKASPLAPSPGVKGLDPKKRRGTGKAGKEFILP